MSEKVRGHTTQIIPGFLSGVALSLIAVGVAGVLMGYGLVAALPSLAGIAVLSIGVAEITGEGKYMQMGYRVAAFGGWLWVTLAFTELLREGEPLLLPYPYLTVLFGFASGVLMLSLFQDAGWIKGPLLSENTIKYE